VISPYCAFFATPGKSEAETFRITDPDIVLGCKNRQGDGPLFFYVPVQGGAVRVPVCPEHAEHLKRHHGS
jgi:hypothetical protein